MKKYFPGARVGRLTLTESFRLPGQRLRWKARCDCGNITSVNSSGLTQTQSCGCLQRERATELQIDMAGREIGYLSVLRENGRDTSGCTQWLCRCRCGREVTIDGRLLRKHEQSGKPRGCTQTCTRRKYAVHDNVSQGGAYNSWRMMRNRCLNPKDDHYPRYGGRGITVCARWNDFAAFYADMGERPVEKTLGRIDNDGNYEPSNCQWENKWQQAANRSTNRHATFVCAGCQHATTMTFAEWARALRIEWQFKPSGGSQHEE